MKYLLDEEEFKNLGPKQDTQLLVSLVDILREKVIELSGYPCRKTYCDDCPIVALSNKNEEAFTGVAGSLLNRFCTLPKNFSK